MSIDMSQFYQVFFEETGEHLANMESLLLELDIDAPDAEQLNAIFRAAHSIKGSSGTFGFTDLQDVTHILENLLDRIRKGELALREEMVDAFLDAGDVLKELLAAHKGEGEADSAVVEAICARLRDLTTSAPSPSSVVAAMPVASGEASPPAAGHDLQFVLEGEEAEVEKTLANLLDELAEHGAVRVVGRPSSAGQPWRLELLGVTDEDAVRGVLDFVARSDSIRITPAGGSPPDDSSGGAYGFFADESVPAPTGSDDGAYGFFTDEPIQPSVAASSSGDNGYGFFEPLPAASESLTEEQAALPPPSSAAGDTMAVELDQRGFGFLVDSTPMLSAVAGSEGKGYGFLRDVPRPAPDAPSAADPPHEDKQAAPEKSRKPASSPVKPGGDTTIRVGIDKVDQLINLVGELVITQAMLTQSASDVDPVAFERLHDGLTQLERNSRDLQEAVMSIRMMPISVVFSRFPRVVRDLSQKLGKQVELKTIGEDTELDRSLIERISDPLTHLVRNSLDHGVEMPEARAAKGKQPAGTITLKAYHQSGNIVIEVGDDGAGLDRNRILAKAKERGMSVSDQMSDSEVWQLIFEAGFSTAEQVTEVSGRGVGMDVVKRNIHAMGGRVEIESMTGIGTRMTVRLPLTLAILDGMSVAVGHENYIIPLGYVIESVQAERGMIKSVSGVERLLRVRDEYLPVVALHEVFRVSSAVTALDRGIMVILEADGIKAALFVDALIGQHQVVIKSLEANYRKVSGISGATIMGDGHVALILDVAALVDMGRQALPAA